MPAGRPPLDETARPRLAIVSPFPPSLSGVGQYGWHLAGGLARTGRFQSITVFADAAAASTQGTAPPGVTVRRVWRRDDPATPLLLWKALAAERPDVVWLNAGLTIFGRSHLANFAGLSLPALLRRGGLRLLVTLHELAETVHLPALGLRNGPLTHWGARQAVRLLLQADTLVVTLRRYAERLERGYGARHVHHVPHGAFGEVAAAPAAPQAGPALLCFTSLAPHRGLEVLLRAFPLVRARLPAATLTLAGDDHPRFPGYGAQLRAALNGQAGLRWAGAQPEAGLAELFTAARVVVLPYLATTGASSVLSRAAALGRPAVASDLPELRATAEEAGLRVVWTPPGDAPALAQALGDLLADPARQAELAGHNLEAMRPLALSATSQRYADLLTGIAGR
ncbi:MAG: glycosyltransferase [Anaerolineales bacterium]|nr:glycosyltransferase [Anaerolineales bacterium]